MKKIVICTESEAFLKNQVFDPDWAVKFPGAEAMVHLKKLADNAGIEIVTCDIALENVNSGKWKAQDLQLITEADCWYADELIKKGGTPKVILCFESPIFAWKFYDNIQQTAAKYENHIFFRGIFDTFTAESSFNHNAYFPSFDKSRTITSKIWRDRKYMVLVAGNKFWKKPAKSPISLKLSKYRKWWKRRITEKASTTLREAIGNELQSKRLSMIEHFGSKGKLNIFGRGWDKLNKIPLSWQKRLKNILSSINPQPCDNKVKTISEYKFAIAFENVSYPGYITEKIIDCFAASVIPIYLGAPDVTDFIPPEAFIDMRKFESIEQLENHLDTIDSEKLKKTIDSGKSFLESNAGSRYSYQSYAKVLFNIIK